MQRHTLNNASQIPALGLGTWKSAKGAAQAAVTAALRLGYSHIDCAPIYKNEIEIGEALAKEIALNTITRERLWVSSKLWNNAHRPRHVRPALERSLKDLRLDYLDLFLIHWPVSFRQGIEFPKKPEDFLAPGEIPVIETWQAMEEMVKKGLCRSIGVCNFNQKKLSSLHEKARIKPAVNQVELHPFLQQTKLLRYCKKMGITLTAYSPLGSPDRPKALRKDAEPQLLNHPVLHSIAKELQASPAQVLLAWGLHRETVVIPKTISATRLAENLKATELTLESHHRERIDSLDLNYRYIDGSFFCPIDSPYTLTKIWGE